MKKIICLFLVSVTISVSHAQSHFDKIAKSLNEQKTANSKDILTTLFRASLDSLLGKEHSFAFNASFFGIDSIFRGPRSKKLTHEDERKLRRHSFNISLTGDTSNNIKKIAGGFTFTIINKKDIIYTKFEEIDDALLARKEAIMMAIMNGYEQIFASRHPDLANDINRKKIIDETWELADNKNDFTNIDPYIKEALMSNDIVGKAMAAAKKRDVNTTISSAEIEAAIKTILVGKSPLKKLFIDIAEKYSRKPLWTFTPTAVYDREAEQGEYKFASEFTVGLGNNLERKPWELEIKSQFKIGCDTVVKKTNYDNKPFFISVGLNKVVLESEENEPKMEFKLFTQYDYQFGTVAPGAKAGVFTFNSTFRVKVFKSLWLPVTLKYDPENHNFFGLFSLTANLGD